MEKIPYKPGDVLEMVGINNKEEGRIGLEYETIIDVSKNEYVAFLGSGEFFTKKELDDMGYQLKIKWVPKENELYYFFADNGEVLNANFYNLGADMYRLKINNVFKTRREAWLAYRKIMNS